MSTAKPKQRDFVAERLRNHKLSSPTFQDPANVVRWFGAVQAQDFHGAKWALALRMRKATNASVEEAFNRGEIVRTHLLRPTWHFIAPDDIRWLLQLSGPRVNQRCAGTYRKYELDAAIFKRTNRAITKALEGGKHRTRTELKAALNRAGAAADDGVRLAHILLRAELDGVVCSGPRRGNQFTYALLDERVPQGKQFGRDEALAELTRRYFTSHGPATLADYVWWSGLTTNDARRGIAMLDRELDEVHIEGTTYWSSNKSKRSENPPAGGSPAAGVRRIQRRLQKPPTRLRSICRFTNNDMGRTRPDRYRQRQNRRNLESNTRQKRDRHQRRARTDAKHKRSNRCRQSGHAIRSVYRLTASVDFEAKLGGTRVNCVTS